MVLDGLIVLWLTGVFDRRRRTGRADGSAAQAAAMVALVVAVVAAGVRCRKRRRQDAKPGDAQAIEAISMTRLAYVLTGDPAIDSISRAGLEGLTQFLIEKTALEPGDPAGVDLEQGRALVLSDHLLADRSRAPPCLPRARSRASTST